MENCSQVTEHHIFIFFQGYSTLLIKASSLAFRPTPPTVFTYTSYDYDMKQHTLFQAFSIQLFGRVITHQTQPSSLHVLLPCNGGVSCSVCDAFILFVQEDICCRYSLEVSCPKCHALFFVFVHKKHTL